MKNCTIGELCTGSINSTSVHYYSVQYSFSPSTVKNMNMEKCFLFETIAFITLQTVRVTTNMIYDIKQDAPILVVVRQIRGVVSWTLPYAFSNG